MKILKTRLVFDKINRTVKVVDENDKVLSALNADEGGNYLFVYQTYDINEGSQWNLVKFMFDNLENFGVEDCSGNDMVFYINCFVVLEDTYEMELGNLNGYFFFQNLKGENVNYYDFNNPTGFEETKKER